MPTRYSPRTGDEERKKSIERSERRKKRNSSDTRRIKRALDKGNISVNKNISLNEKAEILLGVLDCAVRSEKKNYSLITTCDDTEVIENENILDSTSYNVNPTPISAKDKFTNVSDPFYNLDSDIPDRYSVMNSAFVLKDLPDFVCFAAKLYKSNGNSNNNTHEATGSMATTTTTAATTMTTTTTTY
jgi:hypothetical protein